MGKVHKSSNSECHKRSSEPFRVQKSGWVYWEPKTNKQACTHACTHAHTHTHTNHIPEGKIHIVVICVVTPCHVVEIPHSFKAVCSSQMLVPTHNIARCHNKEDCNVTLHWIQNLRSQCNAVLSYLRLNTVQTESCKRLQAAHRKLHLRFSQKENFQYHLKPSQHTKLLLYVIQTETYIFIWTNSRSAVVKSVLTRLWGVQL
jgi:hypothetical protein